MVHVEIIDPTNSATYPNRLHPSNFIVLQATSLINLVEELFLNYQMDKFADDLIPKYETYLFLWLQPFHNTPHS